MLTSEVVEKEFDISEEFTQKLSALDEALQRFSDEEMIQVALLLDQQVQFLNRSPVTEMELILTYRCNLACDYCFMRKQNLCMSKETAFKAIDFLIAYSKKHPFVNVTLFGGEPLLSLGLMQDVAEYATERTKVLDKRIYFSCTTNGTLLTEKAFDFSRRFGLLYLLSMDGTEEDHNRHRRFINGKGSFDTIVARLPLLKRRQGWLGARITVMPETIFRLAKSVRTLFQSGINQFLIGLVHEADWDKEAIAEIKNQYELLLSFYLEAMKEGLPLRMAMFEKGLEEVHRERKPLWGCGAGTGRVAVTPDGQIYPCSRFVGSDNGKSTYQIGHIEDGFNKSKLPQAIRTGVWARSKCRRCPLSEICTGGCPAVNLESTGSLYEPPKAYCAEVRAWANTVSKLPESVLTGKVVGTQPCPVEG
jgi:uncharacterized protein